MNAPLNRNHLAIIARAFGRKIPFTPSPTPGETKALREAAAIRQANQNRAKIRGKAA